MLGVAVLQIKAHRPQIAALGLLEQGILHAGQRCLCAHADGLCDAGILRAPAPEGAGRHTDLLTDLGLVESVHSQPLQSQQAAGAVPFADEGFSCQGVTPYEKTAHTGLSEEALRAEDDPGVRRFGYDKTGAGKE